MMINLDGEKWKVCTGLCFGTVAVVTNAHAVSRLRQNKEEEREWVPDNVRCYAQKVDIYPHGMKQKYLNLELYQLM